MDPTRLRSSELIQNVLITRQTWLRKLLDPRRDLDLECGYPSSLGIQDYVQLWDRSDLAARVVRLMPEETWADDPQVYETEDEQITPFEERWEALRQRRKLFSYLQRADVLSGVGRFGILLIGLDDGRPLSDPVEGFEDRPDTEHIPELDLLYLRPLSEQVVSIGALETNSGDPRFGQPTRYLVQFTDAGIDNAVTSSATVHWQRVIHLADNRCNSEIYGTPRMQTVFNRLLDLRKIAGGSGEMFWKGGFPGYSLEAPVAAEGAAVELDTDATKEQMAAYMDGLQRYIALVGLNAKSLAVEIADPRPHVEVQLKLIASALGVPWRILVGSEAAQLASEQDARTWNRRLHRRRTEYVTPFIIQPFIERLIALGVLPSLETGNRLIVDWPDLNTPSDLDRAAVAERRTNALRSYVESGADVLMPPFLYLTLVLGLGDDEARAVVEAASERVSGEPAPGEPRTEEQ